MLQGILPYKYEEEKKEAELTRPPLYLAKNHPSFHLLVAARQRILQWAPSGEDNAERNDDSGSNKAADKGSGVHQTTLRRDADGVSVAEREPTTLVDAGMRGARDRHGLKMMMREGAGRLGGGFGSYKP